MYGSPVAGIVWPRPLITARLARSRSASVSQTASNTGECPQELQWLEVGRALVQKLARGDLRVDPRIARRHPQAARLRDGQRAHGVRSQRRRVQRDHRAVGVPDEMRAVAEQLGDHRRLGLEVAADKRRAAGEARPVGQHERPLLAQRQLVAPRQLGAHHAAVHEHHGRSGAAAQHVEIRGAHTAHAAHASLAGAH